MITVHADRVGSLLRPPELLKAREKTAAGCPAPSEFKAIEDRAVAEGIKLQEEAGLAVITDGELRRLSFQSRFAEALEGLGEWDLEAFLWGEWYRDDAAIGELQLRRLHVRGKSPRLARLLRQGFVRPSPRTI